MASPEDRYLVGEPILKPGNRDSLFFPVGQVAACHAVLGELPEPGIVVRKLREEYVSVVRALGAMGVEFRIVYAHPDMIDEETLGALGSEGLKFARFGAGFFPPSVAFPRDFAAVLPGLVLFNEDVRLKASESGAWALRSSPFGQGGRMLASGTTVVVSDRLCRRREHSEPVEGAAVEMLAERGLKVARCPPPVLARIDDLGRITATAVNDHVDRIAALVRDPGGRPHLILDPGAVTARFSDPGDTTWKPMGPDETFETLRSEFGPFEIAVHRAPPFRNPYALNLVQFADRRVLMTGGDPELETFVEELTGSGTVHTTTVPIRYMPTWLCGGIRCLVSDEPTPVFGTRER